MTVNPRWPADVDPDRAARYAARFAALAADGVDVHGEATFCAALVEPGARVLDAGCGTGRVAIRLAQLGFVCVGVDNDEHMLAQARAASAVFDWTYDDRGPGSAGPGPVAPEWARADLSCLDREPSLERGSSLDDKPEPVGDRIAGPFDLVVAAGNVVPLVAPGTEAATILELARALAPDGVLVTGFGIDAEHLPLDQAPFGLADYDRWCATAGLRLVERFATWARDPYDGGGYVVNVHRLG